MASVRLGPGRPVGKGGDIYYQFRQRKKTFCMATNFRDCLKSLAFKPSRAFKPTAADEGAEEGEESADKEIHTTGF